MSSILVVRDLQVSVGEAVAVGGISFELTPGRRTGLIGESGSGKTLTALSIMGLLPDGITASGEVLYAGEDLLRLDEDSLCRLRGDRMTMIFQEPMTALNPVMRIGEQVAEPLLVHRRAGSRRAAEEQALEMLRRVQIPDPEEKMRAYPHQLSGGQRQRVMIAAAMACGPDLVIADEPTTALDVTVQAQVLELLNRMVDEEQATLLLITHDLAVVAEVCQEVMVMYGGRIVESGPAGAVFAEAHHPYTVGLMDAIPSMEHVPADRHLRAIPGSVPPLGAFPSGCPFRNRCPRATEQCSQMPPLVEIGGHLTACWHPVLD